MKTQGETSRGFPVDTEDGCTEICRRNRECVVEEFNIEKQ